MKMPNLTTNAETRPLRASIGTLDQVHNSFAQVRED